MSNSENTRPAFVVTDTGEMINLHFVKSIKPEGKTIIVTVPDGSGEVSHYIKRSDEVLESLRQYCVN